MATSPTRATLQQVREALARAGAPVAQPFLDFHETFGGYVFDCVLETGLLGLVHPEPEWLVPNEVEAWEPEPPGPASLEGPHRRRELEVLVGHRRGGDVTTRHRVGGSQAVSPGTLSSRHFGRSSPAHAAAGRATFRPTTRPRDSRTSCFRGCVRTSFRNSRMFTRRCTQPPTWRCG